MSDTHPHRLPGASASAPDMAHAGKTPLRVAVSGAGGLVGRRLTAALTGRGHDVRRLVRREPAGPEEILFDPLGARLDKDKLEGLDAVVHLAGENVAAGRWTAQRRRRIRDSRVLGTRLVAESLAALQMPPRAMISASAIGFYGDRGDEAVDETSRPGRGFLAETSLAWEGAAVAAEQAGVRLVRLRIGVVLSAAGGALGRMLPVFRLGLGGRIGDGRQFVSWISAEDLVAVIGFALENPDLRGPVNAVGPEPVRNAELTRVLSRILRRPALFPLPAWAVRSVFGEMGRELLLSSTRVLPHRLGEAGYLFRHPTLESALRFELDRR